MIQKLKEQYNLFLTSLIRKEKGIGSFSDRQAYQKQLPVSDEQNEQLLQQTDEYVIKSGFNPFVRAVAITVICIFIPDQFSWAFNYNSAILYPPKAPALVAPQIAQDAISANLVTESLSHLFSKIVNQPPARVEIKLDAGTKNLVKRKSENDFKLGINFNKTFTSEQVVQITTWLHNPAIHHLNCGVFALSDVLKANHIQKTPEEVSVMTLSVDLLSGIVKPNDARLKTSLYAISQVAKAFKLDYRAAQLKPEHVLRLDPPFIASLSGEHFVTVTGIDANGVSLMDLGRPTRMTVSTFESKATGFVLARGLDYFYKATFTDVPDGMQAFVWGDKWRNKSGDLPGLMSNSEIWTSVILKVVIFLVSWYMGGDIASTLFSFAVSDFIQTVGQVGVVEGWWDAKGAYIVGTAISTAISMGVSSGGSASSAEGDVGWANGQGGEAVPPTTTSGETVGNGASGASGSWGNALGTLAVGLAVGAAKGAILWELDRYLTKELGTDNAILKSTIETIASAAVGQALNCAVAAAADALSSANTDTSENTTGKDNQNNTDNTSKNQALQQPTFTQFLHGQLNPGNASFWGMFTSQSFLSNVAGALVSGAVRYIVSGGEVSDAGSCGKKKNCREESELSSSLGQIGYTVGSSFVGYMFDKSKRDAAAADARKKAEDSAKNNKMSDADIKAAGDKAEDMSRYGGAYDAKNKAEVWAKNFLQYGVDAGQVDSTVLGNDGTSTSSYDVSKYSFSNEASSNNFYDVGISNWNQDSGSSNEKSYFESSGVKKDIFKPFDSAFIEAAGVNAFEAEKNDIIDRNSFSSTMLRSVGKAALTSGISLLLLSMDGTDIYSNKPKKDQTYGDKVNLLQKRMGIYAVSSLITSGVMAAGYSMGTFMQDRADSMPEDGSFNQENSGENSTGSAFWGAFKDRTQGFGQGFLGLDSQKTFSDTSANFYDRMAAASKAADTLVDLGGMNLTWAVSETKRREALEKQNAGYRMDDNGNWVKSGSGGKKLSAEGLNAQYLATEYDTVRPGTWSVDYANNQFKSGITNNFVDLFRASLVFTSKNTAKAFAKLGIDALGQVNRGGQIITVSYDGKTFRGDALYKNQWHSNWEWWNEKKPEGTSDEEWKSIQEDKYNQEQTNKRNANSWFVIEDDVNGEMLSYSNHNAITAKQKDIELVGFDKKGNIKARKDYGDFHGRSKEEVDALKEEMGASSYGMSGGSLDMYAVRAARMAGVKVFESVSDVSGGFTNWTASTNGDQKETTASLTEYGANGSYMTRGLRAEDFGYERRNTFFIQGIDAKNVQSDLFVNQLSSFDKVVNRTWGGNLIGMHAGDQAAFNKLFQDEKTASSASSTFFEKGVGRGESSQAARDVLNLGSSLTSDGLAPVSGTFQLFENRAAFKDNKASASFDGTAAQGELKSAIMQQFDGNKFNVIFQSGTGVNAKSILSGSGNDANLNGAVLLQGVPLNNKEPLLLNGKLWSTALMKDGAALDQRAATFSQGTLVYKKNSENIISSSSWGIEGGMLSSVDSAKDVDGVRMNSVLALAEKPQKGDQPAPDSSTRAIGNMVKGGGAYKDVRGFDLAGMAQINEKGPAEWINGKMEVRGKDGQVSAVAPDFVAAPAGGGGTYIGSTTTFKDGTQQASVMQSGWAYKGVAQVGATLRQHAYENTNENIGQTTLSFVKAPEGGILKVEKKEGGEPLVEKKLEGAGEGGKTISVMTGEGALRAYKDEGYYEGSLAGKFEYGSTPENTVALSNTSSNKEGIISFAGSTGDKKMVVPLPAAITEKEVNKQRLDLLAKGPGADDVKQQGEARLPGSGVKVMVTRDEEARRDRASVQGDVKFSIEGMSPEYMGWRPGAEFKIDPNSVRDKDGTVFVLSTGSMTTGFKSTQETYRITGDQKGNASGIAVFDQDRSGKLVPGSAPIAWLHNFGANKCDTGVCVSDVATKGDLVLKSVYVGGELKTTLGSTGAVQLSSEGKNVLTQYGYDGSRPLVVNFNSAVGADGKVYLISKNGQYAVDGSKKPDKEKKPGDTGANQQQKVENNVASAESINDINPSTQTRALALQQGNKLILSAGNKADKVFKTADDAQKKTGKNEVSAEVSEKLKGGSQLVFDFTNPSNGPAYKAADSFYAYTKDNLQATGVDASYMKEDAKKGEIYAVKDKVVPVDAAAIIWNSSTGSKYIGQWQSKDKAIEGGLASKIDATSLKLQDVGQVPGWFAWTKTGVRANDWASGSMNLTWSSVDKESNQVISTAKANSPEASAKSEAMKKDLFNAFKASGLDATEMGNFAKTYVEGKYSNLLQNDSVAPLGVPAWSVQGNGLVHMATGSGYENGMFNISQGFILEKSPGKGHGEIGQKVANKIDILVGGEKASQQWGVDNGYRMIHVGATPLFNAPSSFAPTAYHLQDRGYANGVYSLDSTASNPGTKFNEFSFTTLEERQLNKYGYDNEHVSVDSIKMTQNLIQDDGTTKMLGKPQAIIPNDYSGDTEYLTPKLSNVFSGASTSLAAFSDELNANANNIKWGQGGVISAWDQKFSKDDPLTIKFSNQHEVFSPDGYAQTYAQKMDNENFADPKTNKAVPGAGFQLVDKNVEGNTSTIASFFSNQNTNSLANDGGYQSIRGEFSKNYKVTAEEARSEIPKEDILDTKKTDKYFYLNFNSMADIKVEGDSDKAHPQESIIFDGKTGKSIDYVNFMDVYSKDGQYVQPENHLMATYRITAGDKDKGDEFVKTTNYTQPIEIQFKDRIYTGTSGDDGDKKLIAHYDQLNDSSVGALRNFEDLSKWIVSNRYSSTSHTATVSGDPDKPDLTRLGVGWDGAFAILNTAPSGAKLWYVYQPGLLGGAAELKAIMSDEFPDQYFDPNTSAKSEDGKMSFLGGVLRPIHRYSTEGETILETKGATLNLTTGNLFKDSLESFIKGNKKITIDSEGVKTKILSSDDLDGAQYYSSYVDEFLSRPFATDVNPVSMALFKAGLGWNTSQAVGNVNYGEIIFTGATLAVGGFLVKGAARSAVLAEGAMTSSVGAGSVAVESVAAASKTMSFGQVLVSGARFASLSAGLGAAQSYYNGGNLDAIGAAGVTAFRQNLSTGIMFAGAFPLIQMAKSSAAGAWVANNIGKVVSTPTRATMAAGGIAGGVTAATGIADRYYSTGSADIFSKKTAIDFGAGFAQGVLAATVYKGITGRNILDTFKLTGWARTGAASVFAMGIGSSYGLAGIANDVSDGNSLESAWANNKVDFFKGAAGGALAFVAPAWYKSAMSGAEKLEGVTGAGKVAEFSTWQAAKGMAWGAAGGAAYSVVDDYGRYQDKHAGKGTMAGFNWKDSLFSGKAASFAVAGAGLGLLTKAWFTVGKPWVSEKIGMNYTKGSLQALAEDPWMLTKVSALYSVDMALTMPVFNAFMSVADYNIRKLPDGKYYSWVGTADEPGALRRAGGVVDHEGNLKLLPTVSSSLLSGAEMGTRIGPLLFAGQITTGVLQGTARSAGRNGLLDWVTASTKLPGKMVSSLINSTPSTAAWLTGVDVISGNLLRDSKWFELTKQRAGVIYDRENREKGTVFGRDRFAERYAENALAERAGSLSFISLIFKPHATNKDFVAADKGRAERQNTRGEKLLAQAEKIRETSPNDASAAKKESAGNKLINDAQATKLGFSMADSYQEIRIKQEKLETLSPETSQYHVLKNEIDALETQAGKLSEERAVYIGAGDKKAILGDSLSIEQQGQRGVLLRIGQDRIRHQNLWENSNPVVKFLALKGKVAQWQLDRSKGAEKSVVDKLTEKIRDRFEAAELYDRKQYLKQEALSIEKDAGSIKKLERKRDRTVQEDIKLENLRVNLEARKAAYELANLSHKIQQTARDKRQTSTWEFSKNEITEDKAKEIVDQLKQQGYTLPATYKDGLGFEIRYTAREQLNQAMQDLAFRKQLNVRLKEEDKQKTLTPEDVRYLLEREFGAPGRTRLELKKNQRNNYEEMYKLQSQAIERRKVDLEKEREVTRNDLDQRLRDKKITQEEHSFQINEINNRIADLKVERDALKLEQLRAEQGLDRENHLSSFEKGKNDEVLGDLSAEIIKAESQLKNSLDEQSLRKAFHVQLQERVRLAQEKQVLNKDFSSMPWVEFQQKATEIENRKIKALEKVSALDDFKTYNDFKKFESSTDSLSKAATAVKLELARNALRSYEDFLYKKDLQERSEKGDKLAALELDLIDSIAMYQARLQEVALVKQAREELESAVNVVLDKIKTIFDKLIQNQVDQESANRLSQQKAGFERGEPLGETSGITLDRLVTAINEEIKSLSSLAKDNDKATKRIKELNGALDQLDLVSSPRVEDCLRELNQKLEEVKKDLKVEDSVKLKQAEYNRLKTEMDIRRLEAMQEVEIDSERIGMIHDEIALLKDRELFLSNDILLIQTSEGKTPRQLRETIIKNLTDLIQNKKGSSLQQAAEYLLGKYIETEGLAAEKFVEQGKWDTFIKEISDILQKNGVDNKAIEKLIKVLDIQNVYMEASRVLTTEFSAKDKDALIEKALNKLEGSEAFVDRANRVKFIRLKIQVLAQQEGKEKEIESWRDEHRNEANALRYDWKNVPPYIRQEMARESIELKLDPLREAFEQLNLQKMDDRARLEQQIKLLDQMNRVDGDNPQYRITKDLLQMRLNINDEIDRVDSQAKQANGNQDQLNVLFDGFKQFVEARITELNGLTDMPQDSNGLHAYLMTQVMLKLLADAAGGADISSKIDRFKLILEGRGEEGLRIRTYSAITESPTALETANKIFEQVEKERDTQPGAPKKAFFYKTSLLGAEEVFADPARNIIIHGEKAKKPNLTQARKYIEAAREKVADPNDPIAMDRAVATPEIREAINKQISEPEISGADTRKEQAALEQSMGMLKSLQPILLDSRNTYFQTATHDINRARSLLESVEIYLDEDKTPGQGDSAKTGSDVFIKNINAHLKNVLDQKNSQGMRTVTLEQAQRALESFDRNGLSDRENKVLDIYKAVLPDLYKEFDNNVLEYEQSRYLVSQIEACLRLIDKIGGSDAISDNFKGVVLSLAMSGGKTKMEGLLAPHLLDYITRRTDYADGKGSIIGIIIGKPEALVEDAVRDPNLYRRYSDADRKLLAGHINVMTYNEMKSLALERKQEAQRNGEKFVSPFKGYLVLCDEIHELMLAVPMITSSRSVADQLLNMGESGRKKLFNEQKEARSFAEAGKELIDMRMAALESLGYSSDAQKVDSYIKAIGDLVISTSLQSSQLNNRDLFVLKDGKLFTVKELVQKIAREENISLEEARNKVEKNENSKRVEALLRDVFNEKTSVDGEVRDNFLAHWRGFTTSWAQVVQNEIRHDNFRAEFNKNTGRLDMVTIERLRSGVEDKDRVYTDESGLNAYMRMIIAKVEVDSGNSISLEEFHRLTDRNLHYQMTSSELLTTFDGFVGYTGTAKIIEPVLELSKINVMEFGTTLEKEMFKYRKLDLFKGSDAGKAEEMAQNWVKETVASRSLAKVLLLNMATTDSREATEKKLRDVFGEDVVILAGDNKSFATLMQDDAKQYYGKKVIIVSSGDSGVNPPPGSIEFAHYDFTMRGTYSHLQAIARGDYLMRGGSAHEAVKSGEIDIRRAICTDFRQVVNIDSIMHDSLLSRSQVDTLASLQRELDATPQKSQQRMDAEEALRNRTDPAERKMLEEALKSLPGAERDAAEKKLRNAVDQIMESLEFQEKQHAIRQTMAVVKNFNRAKYTQYETEQYHKFIQGQAGRYLDHSTGVARIYDGVSGDGYFEMRKSANSTEYTKERTVAFNGGNGLQDSQGQTYLPAGYNMVELSSNASAVVYTNNDLSALRVQGVTASGITPVSYLIMTDTANLNQWGDESPTVKSWVKAEAVDKPREESGENKKELRLVRDMPVMIDGKREILKGVESFYELDLYSGAGKFLRMDTNKLAGALGLHTLWKRSLPVAEEKSTAQGYKYQIIKSTKNGPVVGIIFEGALYKVENNQFNAFVAEDITLTDMRRDQLRLKVSFEIKDDVARLTEAEVANDAPVLMGDGGFTKGNKVSIRTTKEKGEKTFSINGRAVMIAGDGNAYDKKVEEVVDKDGKKEIKVTVQTDAARMRVVSWDPVTGKSSVVRVDGHKNYKEDDVNQTYQLDSLVFKDGLDKESLLKDAIVDSKTGIITKKVGEKIEKIGMYFASSETVYLHQNETYDFSDEDTQIMSKIESLGIPIEEDIPGGKRVKRAVFEKAMSEFNEVAEDLEIVYQQLVATAGADIVLARRCQELINKLKLGFEAKITAYDSKQNSLGLVEDNKIPSGAVTFGIVLDKKGDFTTKETSVLQLLHDEFIAKGEAKEGDVKNKDIVLNPYLDVVNSAAQSNDTQLQFGASLGLSFVLGIVKPSEAGVFIHELLHEFNKVQIGKGRAGMLQQARVTNLSEEQTLLLKRLGIYWKQFSNEEIIAHYLEIYGTNIDRSGNVTLPDEIKVFADAAFIKDFEEFLTKAYKQGKGLPRHFFKGKIHLMQEAFDHGDFKAAREQAGVIADMMRNRVKGFAQVSELSFAAAFNVVDAMDLKALKNLLVVDKKSGAASIVLNVEAGSQKFKQEQHIPADVYEGGKDLKKVKSYLLETFKRSKEFMSTMAQRTTIDTLMFEKLPFDRQFKKAADELVERGKADDLIKFLGASGIPERQITAGNPAQEGGPWRIVKSSNGSLQSNANNFWEITFEYGKSQESLDWNDYYLTQQKIVEISAQAKLMEESDSSLAGNRVLKRSNNLRRVKNVAKLVKLLEKESSSLSGKRVYVTRPRDVNGDVIKDEQGRTVQLVVRKMTPEKRRYDVLAVIYEGVVYTNESKTPDNEFEFTATVTENKENEDGVAVKQFVRQQMKVEDGRVVFVKKEPLSIANIVEYLRFAIEQNNADELEEALIQASREAPKVGFKELANILTLGFNLADRIKNPVGVEMFLQIKVLAKMALDKLRVANVVELKSLQQVALFEKGNVQAILEIIEKIEAAAEGSSNDLWQQLQARADMLGVQNQDLQETLLDFLTDVSTESLSTKEAPTPTTAGFVPQVQNIVPAGTGSPALPLPINILASDIKDLNSTTMSSEEKAALRTKIFNQLDRAMRQGIITKDMASDARVRQLLVDAAMRVPKVTQLFKPDNAQADRVKVIYTMATMPDRAEVQLTQKLDRAASIVNTVDPAMIDSPEFAKAVKDIQNHTQVIDAFYGGEIQEGTTDVGSSFRASSTAATKDKDGKPIINMGDKTWAEYALGKIDKAPDPTLELFTYLLRGLAIPLKELDPELKATYTTRLKKNPVTVDAAVKVYLEQVKLVPGIAARGAIIKEIAILALGETGAKDFLAKVAASGAAVSTFNPLMVKRLNPSIVKMRSQYRRHLITRHEFMAWLDKWELTLSSDDKIIYKDEAAMLRIAALKNAQDEALANKVKVRKAIKRYYAALSKATTQAEKDKAHTQFTNYMQLIAGYGESEPQEQVDARNRAMFPEIYDAQNVEKAHQEDLKKVEVLKGLVKEYKVPPPEPKKLPMMDDGANKFQEKADGTIESQESMGNEILRTDDGGEFVDEKKAYEKTSVTGNILNQVGTVIKKPFKIKEYGAADDYNDLKAANDSAQITGNVQPGQFDPSSDIVKGIQAHLLRIIKIKGYKDDSEIPAKPDEKALPPPPPPAPVAPANGSGPNPVPGPTPNPAGPTPMPGPLAEKGSSQSKKEGS